MIPIRFAKLESKERDLIYGASRIALCQKREGLLGKDYLLWERGLDEGTIAKFRLGYVPFSYDHAFAGRIVMPIFDAYSDLLALSCRPIYKSMTLKDKVVVAIGPKTDGKQYSYTDEQGRIASVPYGDVLGISDPDPKYWNESFSKGEHFFGLQLAKCDIVRFGFVILVEGQFDVMMMHALGFTNTIGLCGGAFTPIHAMLLRRWTKQVVILLDGDKAGRAHAQKVKDILDVYGFRAQQRPEEPKKKWEKPPERRGPIVMNVKYAIVTLPEEDDPDTFLKRNGSFAMRRMIYDAMAQASLIIPRNAHDIAA